MLTYHQAFDSYHCFLRILTFLYGAGKAEHDIDTIRIFDYYFCSPASLRYFKFPQHLRTARRIFSEKVTPYNDIQNQNSLFYELRPIQNAAINKMVALNFLDNETFHNGRALLIRSNIPDALANIIKASKSLDKDVKRLVFEELLQLPLLGQNGLKHRSGLMDYRYDLA